MQCAVVNLKSKGRMPVRIVPAVYLGDVQQQLPMGWCIACRRELFEPEKSLCLRCERMMDDVSE